MSESNRVVNLCLLRLPLRLAAESSLPFAPSAVAALGRTSSNKAGLDAFFAQLQEQRTALLALLTEDASAEADVDGALTAYLSNLNHLTTPDVSLQSGWSIAWKDALTSKKTVVFKTLEYEVVSVLLATALWKTSQGAKYMIFAEGGLGTSSASRAFLLYRKAIGMIEYCERFLRENEREGGVERTDVDRSVLTPLIHLLFAEIQGITVLRAIEKGNAPSLISSLALDAERRYSQCTEELEKHDSTGSFLQKVWAYAVYKAVCFGSYAYVFLAWAKLSGGAGGAAVRLATEAEKIFGQATEKGINYDSTHPQTQITERESFHVSLRDTSHHSSVAQDTLQRAVVKAKKQAESDNRHVYYDKIPNELPELPQPKQLVGSLVYDFPGQSSQVGSEIFSGLNKSSAVETSPETIIEVIPGSRPTRPGAEASETKEQEQRQETGGTHWWKWLLVIIAAPLLLLATFAGFGVWIILIPFKIFCWPVGLLAQLLWNVVEYLIKAPLRAMLWASGAEWRPAKAETPSTE